MNQQNDGQIKWNFLLRSCSGSSFAFSSCYFLTSREYYFNEFDGEQNIHNFWFITRNCQLLHTHTHKHTPQQSHLMKTLLSPSIICLQVNLFIYDAQVIQKWFIFSLLLRKCHKYSSSYFSYIKEMYFNWCLSCQKNFFVLFQNKYSFCSFEKHFRNSIL